VLYVKNLKSLVSEDELRQVFEPYGQIGRVKKTKDYGFIHFENREDALRAMEELNGTVRCSHACFCVGFSALILLFGPENRCYLLVMSHCIGLQNFDMVGRQEERMACK